MKIRGIQVLFGHYPETNQKLDYCFDANINFVDSKILHALRKLKLETEKISFITVELVANKDRIKNNTIIGENFIVNALFSHEQQEEYLCAGWIGRVETYLHYFELGFRSAAEQFGLPLDKLLSIIQDFRDNGYKNTIEFKKLRIKEHGLRVFFNVHYLMNEAKLVMTAYKLSDKSLVCKKTIYRSYPHEDCYYHKFRKVFVNENSIVLLDFLSHPSFEIPIQSILDKNVTVKYYNEKDKKDMDDSPNLVKKYFIKYFENKEGVSEEDDKYFIDDPNDI